MRGTLSLLLLLGLCPAPATGSLAGIVLKLFLDDYNHQASTQMNADTNAQWNWAVQTTDANQALASKADGALAQFQVKWAANATSILPQVKSALTFNTNRQLNAIAKVGINLTAADTGTLSNQIANMSKTYANAQICQFVNGAPNCAAGNWSLDPDIFNLLANSTDYATLTYIWNQWRAKLAPNAATYAQFVKLSNKGARAGGFKDTGDWWRSWYESGNFTQQIQGLWYQILPLYEQLHAYVRGQVWNKYKGNYPHYSTLPAQLLGNMWAQEWENIYNWTAPYPNNGQGLDVTPAMVAQGYNASMMFHKADQFFQSLGFKPMVPSFWKLSKITKPNRSPLNFVCHASAWDFYNAKDFRIKMCTSVTMDNLITIHHEMGHIQYYMHYAGQPVVFRNGANPGFHEAIGDTIAKSVSTPAHLQKIGLLNNYVQSDQLDINYLYKQALEKVGFLPWGYLMDQWRWQVFSGNATPANWNQKWWNLRYQLQGLHAPNDTIGKPGSGRPAGAFDPAAKSHIDDNTPYIRYFVSFVVQFQFYKQMCLAANATGPGRPLYQCDFFNSTKAGNLLGNMLSLGSSLPWQQAMTQLTGQPNMDAGPLLDYFSKLQTWLAQKNAANCECYGWGADALYPKSVLAKLPTPRCPAAPNGQLGPAMWKKKSNCPKKPPSAATGLRSSLALAAISPLLLLWRKL